MTGRIMRAARWLIALLGLVGVLAACNPQGPAAPNPNLIVLPTRAPVTSTESTAASELSDTELIRWGQQLYEVNCSACHRSNGEGHLRYFPALNGNALVTAEPPTALINTVLHGRREMPAFAADLSSRELAAILSYIRNAWSNQAAIVQPDQIAAP
jgi:mono/diheme cytochrome c family protein